MKKEYAQPDLEIVYFQIEHPIALSGEGDDLLTPNSTSITW